jgi:hypothetical protein
VPVDSPNCPSVEKLVDRIFIATLIVSSIGGKPASLRFCAFRSRKVAIPPKVQSKVFHAIRST